MAYGIALSGALPPERLARLSTAAEEHGYSSVWVTILAGTTEPVQVLSHVARATRDIDIGLGLIPAAICEPAPLAEAIRAAGTRRISVAIGAGTLVHDAPTRVASAIRALTALVPTASVAVGGYGRRVLAEGGQWADSILLNWATPEHVEWSLRIAQSKRSPTDRRPPPTAHVYIPTMIGPTARDRLDEKLRAMADSQPAHRRHQQRFDPASMGIAATDYDEARRGLRRFDRQHPILLPYPGPDQEIETMLAGLTPRRGQPHRRSR